MDQLNILRLGLELDSKIFQEMLQDIFWIASASVPENSVPSIEWLQLNPKAYPDLWMSILQSENVLNNEPLLGE
jgi:nucleolar pre-ribosomal-associated protein 2